MHLAVSGNHRKLPSIINRTDKEAIDRGYGAGEYFHGKYLNILEFLFSSHC